MSGFSRGELARHAAVNVETLRYYERRGLLRDPRAGRVGYRTYSERDAQRVQFIRAAQGSGFTLKEIARLLSLFDRNDTRCGDVQTIVEGKIEDLEQQIEHLHEIRLRLESMTGKCNRDGAVRNCPTFGMSAFGGRNEAESSG